MAPRIRNVQLETRTARARLRQRRKLYQTQVAPGIHVGYRRNKGTGTWSAVCADGAGGQWIKRIAIADDREDADGTLVMDFWQAADAAKRLGRSESGASTGDRPVTVKEAVEAYQQDLARRGGAERNATSLLRRLTPALAGKAVSLVTRADLMTFRDQLLMRGVARSTVKRYETPLFAALHLAARRDERITNAAAWKLDPLPKSGVVRNVILPDSHVHAIVAAAYGQSHEWGLMVEVLAVTGARISQARSLTVDDLLAGDRLVGDRLDMPVSRKGKGEKKLQKRPVPIPPGLAVKLRVHGAGRRAHERLLLRPDGKPWLDNCQCELFPATVTAAKLDPSEVTSYALRHSSIVRQLLANVPVRVVATNHDTSVEMIEQHYSKYINDHSDTLTRRALLPEPLRAANDNTRQSRAM